jgi:MFS family permease
LDALRALTLMNTFTLFAWWGFYLWLLSYLTQPASAGGVGLQLLSSSGFILLMQVGMWFGYVTFGFVSDRIGRKRTYVSYLLAAAVLLFIYVSIRNPVAFFATGYFSGFGAVTAEIYPTAIRASAQGFTYNIGRIASAAAPWAVGTLAATHGFGAALSLSSAAFVLAAVTWVWIPETKGKSWSSGADELRGFSVHGRRSKRSRNSLVSQYVTGLLQRPVISSATAQ